MRSDFMPKKRKKEDISYLTPKQAKEIQWIEDFHKLFNKFYKLRMKEFKKKPYLQMESFLNFNRLKCLVVSMNFIEYLIETKVIKDFLSKKSNQKLDKFIKKS